ncbi:MAG: hypothetical protein WC596_03675 [Candidatus Shapirobacteria bacterium]
MIDPNTAKIKWIGRRGKIKVFTVNGGKIRTEIDKEFTNFGQHFRFNFIPENEFWIDQEKVTDETKFFIDHMLMEWKLMKKGMDYNQAITFANVAEQAERMRAKDVKEIIDKEGFLKSSQVHKQLWGETDKGVKVWIIDGRLVRSLFFVDFTEGGHFFVYSFVPREEVWIDNDLPEEERWPVLLHELYERHQMEKYGLTYNQAHRKASRLEWNCRTGKMDLQKKLAGLGWKDKKTSVTEKKNQ